MSRKGGKMKKFEIKEYRVEINKREKNRIKAGAALMGECPEPAELGAFDTLEEAKTHLDQYSAKWQDMGAYVLITEYAIELNEYDEGGDLIGGGDVYAEKKVAFKLTSKPEYETNGEYESLAEAEEARSEYDGESYIE